MPTSLRHLLLGAAATVLLAGSVAWAQAPAAPPAAGHDMRAQHFERMCKEMPAIRAGRIAYLEVKLGITEQQRSAWTTYAAEMRAAGDPLRRLCDNPPKVDAQSDAASILGAREQFLSTMLEGTKAARLATEKLQAVLTTEQKATLAEATHRRMARAMGHHHPMHSGMHHGGQAPTRAAPHGGAPGSR